MPHQQQTARVYLIGNAKKPQADKIFRRLADWLEAAGVLIGADFDGRPDLVNDAQPDMVIALGGDGTILSVGQAMKDRQVPIIGVNVGKLGYLAEFSVEELEQFLERILSDPRLISRRMMLDVRIGPPSGKTWSGIALNDCVIRVGEPFRTIGLEVIIDDQAVTTIVGDGLIISTPTGSTAHNMSCGGPIIQPDLEAIILTPKCPHSLTHRPVVIGPDATVRVRALETSEGAAIVLDGQSVHPMIGETQVVIQKSPQQFQLVRHPHRESWDTLVKKLKWGQNLT
ncbi:MAG: NAD(+)/NADH kinase [Dehalococcoidia bacterium]